MAWCHECSTAQNTVFLWNIHTWLNVHQLMVKCRARKHVPDILKLRLAQCVSFHTVMTRIFSYYRTETKRISKFFPWNLLAFVSAHFFNHKLVIQIDIVLYEQYMYMYIATHSLYSCLKCGFSAENDSLVWQNGKATSLRPQRFHQRYRFCFMSHHSSLFLRFIGISPPKNSIFLGKPDLSYFQWARGWYIILLLTQGTRFQSVHCTKNSFKDSLAVNLVVSGICFEYQLIHVLW